MKFLIIKLYIIISVIKSCINQSSISKKIYNIIIVHWFDVLNFLLNKGFFKVLYICVDDPNFLENSESVLNYELG